VTKRHDWQYRLEACGEVVGFSDDYDRAIKQAKEKAKKLEATVYVMQWENVAKVTKDGTVKE